MTGQIAGPSAFSLELVALIVGVSMIVGTVDLIRQPGWAWKRAEESKIAYLILVVLVPVVGLCLYVFKGRPKVATISAAGRAASLPFERFGEEAIKQHRDERWPVGGIAAPVGFDAFSEAIDHQGTPPGETVTEPAPLEVSGTFFSSAGTATRTRTYRPKQRTSLAVAEDAVPTVPAGWKADPTGRHQFRYWDGFHWTENVADAGEQSRDAVTP
ncbi:MAG TPA: DUF2510 domain-containing protein [Acidimicrobiales bacterium]|jgi:Protein of unknown function (DUF2510)/Phospholipase_D-nuclease N-terminal